MTALRHPLRKWQEKAFAAWNSAGQRGIVAAVTGGGKTTFALHCLDSYRKSVPGATAVIVVPTTALLEQWLEEIITYFDIPLSHIVVLNSRTRIRPSRINLGVINTVARVAQTPPDDQVFLIVDECHRAASKIFRGIFAFRTDASLGLSATPERQYDEGLEEVLIPNLGPVIFRYTYKEALADGVIVPFSLNNILFDFEPQELKQYEKLTTAIRIAIQKYGMESPEAVRLMLRRTRISNLSLSRIRIATTLVARHLGRRILLFHEDINACDLIDQILRDNGVASGVYHSRIPLAKRVDCLAAYRRGEISVLVTCRALDEGFNVPETEIGIVAAATATYRQRIQRLGRVLRPAIGKDGAVVYSIVASVPEIRRLADEAKDLEGIAEVSWTRA
jgi:superfamily II DNA or RNA helicase